MAGDWIKMRTDLADDPAVIVICERHNLDADTVVGKLHRLWSWADKHTADGNASVTHLYVDRNLGVTGIANTLQEVGWLTIGESSISIPNFERHNGKSAKKRCETSKRVSEHRKRKCNASSVTKALPEKRREEKRRDSNTEREEPTKTFVKPTLDEVKEYCRQKGYTIDAEKFWFHYEARGWKTREGTLKSWQAAVVTWQKNERQWNGKRCDNSAIGSGSRERSL